MATVQDMHEIMIGIGMKPDFVKGMNANKPLGIQGVDSMDHPAFIVALEDRYHVKLTEKDILKLKTINDFIDFVNKK
ncbi:MAG: acyl carrier protein [Deltaproteobacteria bacterium]|nr:acyl carrier protein [Deltaproteobacteria bacterium]